MRGPHFPLGLLVWLYVVVLWLTWTPVGDGPPEVLLLPYLSSWPVVVGNLLLFAPMGFVLGAGIAAARGPNGGRTTAAVVLGVAVAAGALSLVVELGQFFVPGRHVSPYDLAMNTGGAAAGAWVAARLVRAGRPPMALFAAGAGAVFAGVALFVAVTGFAASRMMELSQWRAEGYRVVAGDEVDGGRAYEGSVDFARICPGPLDAEPCAAPGAGERELDRLMRRALDWQQVRLSAVVRSDGPQPEHARIVTFSRDQGHRNATLSQEGRDLVLRLRTPRGGPNGVGLVFRLPDAVPDGVPTQVYAAYRTGRVVLAAEHEDGTATAEFPLGFLGGWWLMRPLPDPALEAPVLRRAMVVAAAAFALPLGIAAVMSGIGPAVLRVLGGGATPPLLLVLLGGPLRIPTPTWDLLLAAAFGLAGAALGFLGPRWRAGGWMGGVSDEYVEELHPDPAKSDVVHPCPRAVP